MPPKPDVRRLLKKQQQERNKATKITHPFAKYDETGRLACVVCNSFVKSEAVWQAHLGSQSHRDNIQKLKELKQQQQQQQQQQQLKRRANSPPPGMESSSTHQSENKRIRVEDDQDRQDIEINDDDGSNDEQEDEDMGLPADFFDKKEDEEIPEELEETPTRDTADSKALPSGFFDDPEEEARVQGTLAPEEQAKADLAKDVEMFNEAMMDVTAESMQAQEEDDETFWEERHLDITREQAKFDSRVEKLKQLRQTGQTSMIVDQEEDVDEDGIKTGLKTSLRQVLKSKPAKQVESLFEDEDDESDEEESDNDWRAQQL
ncbi:hypothetical protein [Parasitella parasitica]|uniref:Zinc finger protein 830 n=1 Tax=Parasitella parasitica TaxID=35722 RepID=A0A0B7NJL3_9FUNG|nr:hypothetical protein [Parasitella parasitica]